MQIDYDKKILFCQKLGADKFQKVVFKVENLKFKILKKICPNFIKYYDKYCDFERNLKLKKVKDQKGRKQIIDYYRKQKIAMRREFNREENRNYHINLNKPMEILHYLNWNKKVHVEGMIKNIIAIPFLIGMSITGCIPAIPFLIIETVSLFINFQCINIQNCNIYRFKKREESIKKMHIRRLQKNVQQYGKASEVIGRCFDKTDEIPTLSQIIDNINTKEELEQVRALVKSTLSTNETIIKQKKLGIRKSKIKEKHR